MPAQHHRSMSRCDRCARWWSIGLDDSRACQCGGTFVAVDMKAHIAALPAHVATHNHRWTPLETKLKARGSCEACDVEHAAIEKQRKDDEAAKKAAETPKP